MYVWLAVYRDGTSLLGYENDQYVCSTRIEREKLEKIILYGHDRLTPIVTQFYSPGQRVIYRRRIELKAGRQTVCHLLGWQKTVNGESIQHITYAFEDGRLWNSGKFNSEVPWMEATVPIPADAVEVGAG